MRWCARGRRLKEKGSEGNGKKKKKREDLRETKGKKRKTHVQMNG